MIELDLIEFADLVKPKQIVDEITSQIPDLPIPVPLEDIAAAVGINKIEYTTLDGFEGALLADKEKTKGAILINSNSRHHRQRFSLGHELGHYMLPRHGHKMQCGIDDLITKESKNLSSKQKIELEANQFSAEILMPQKHFRSYKGYNNSPSMDCLIAQANDFDVSFEAGAQRYCRLHDEPVAVVFSLNNIVRYSCKSTEFPFWITPGKNDPVPSGSSIRKASNSPENSTYSGSALSSTWIGDDKYFLTPEDIIEEVYVMQNGYVATMLYFEDELEEKEC
ncbi:MAG: ImmA/IrrE family metallo-endopeptidase [Gammaproteobacteria bacterium]|nr:ImmA/IrrE family metallo-endopeptidase [Gammaproteobacteria bacterium]